MRMCACLHLGAFALSVLVCLCVCESKRMCAHMFVPLCACVLVHTNWRAQGPVPQLCDPSLYQNCVWPAEWPFRVHTHCAPCVHSLCAMCTC